MHLKLRKQQLKIITYIKHAGIQKSHGNHKQKSIIDIHTKKEKESKHNTKNSHKITREEKRRRRKGEKRPAKTNPKQLTKWQ